eukprot:302043_1
MTEYPNESWSTTKDIDWSLDPDTLKKNLLPLSKPKLIKLCIAKKVSCIGTKSQIVMRLIEHHTKTKPLSLMHGVVSNGNLDIQIDKFKKLNITDKTFKFFYKIGHKWKYKSINSATFIPDGKFHLSVPIFLSDYNIEFYIKFQDKISTKEILNVPSFLLRTHFGIGETVIFKEEMDSLFTNPGVVEQILEDGYYQIYNYHYNPAKGSKRDPKSWDKVVKVIHYSKIWSNTRKIRKTIDLNNHKIIHKNTLINNNNINAMNTFYSLFDALKPYINILCKDIYGTLKGLAFCRGTNEFLTKNIYDMLFETKFNYKVGCVVDGNDGWCNFVNVTQWDITMIAEILKDNPDVNFLHEACDIHSMIFSCDWCSAEIKTTGYFYVCSHKCFVDKHYYCLNCINNVIKLNGQLKELLIDLLDKYLVNDCVQTIVDFVVGSVVKLC